MDRRPPLFAFRDSRRAALAACAVGLACAASLGCAGAGPVRLHNPLVPSNHRDWEEDLAVLPFAEFTGDEVLVRNVRNCAYLTETDYVVRHYDRRLRLDDVRTVDFWLVPFNGQPALAHTMLSFGLADGTHLCVSAEVRLEKGETYSTLLGALRQYELMYVVGDERDLIRLRTEHRNVEVYCYPTRAAPEQARALLTDMLQRANQLAVKPEFYDLLTNNCTTNLLAHVNRVLPDRAPYDHRILLPGYADRYAYDRGLLDTSRPFAETKAAARVTEAALQYAGAPDFSARIRRR